MPSGAASHFEWLRMIEATLPALQRWLLFIGVVLLCGAVAWRTFIATRLPVAVPAGDPEAGDPDDEALQHLEKRFAGSATLVAFCLLPVWGLRLATQLLEFRDPFTPLGSDLHFLVLETWWGSVWLIQGAVLVALAAVFTRIYRRISFRPAEAVVTSTVPIGWKTALGLVAILGLTISLSGHAMSSPTYRVLIVGADVAHVYAVGAWMGSLTLILTLSAPSPRQRSLFAAQIRLFSPVALVATGVVATTGIALAGVHLVSPGNFWSTRYGVILSVKLGFVAGVMILGYRNWRRGLPVIDSREGARSVYRRAAYEVGVAALVLLLTALLIGSTLPQGHG